MIRRIFLDLDDVCNTLAPFVLHSVGCNIGPTDYADYPREFGYAISDVANYLLGEPRYTSATLWASIPRAIWVKVPESPFFRWLLEACANAVGRENVCIATSPTKCPESLAGKLEWIHDHFPEWMHRQFAITPRKHLFARPAATPSWCRGPGMTTGRRTLVAISKKNSGRWSKNSRHFRRIKYRSITPFARIR